MCPVLPEDVLEHASKDALPGTLAAAEGKGYASNLIGILEGPGCPPHYVLERLRVAIGQHLPNMAARALPCPLLGLNRKALLALQQRSSSHVVAIQVKQIESVINQSL